MLPANKRRISFEDLVGYLSVLLRHLRLMVLLVCLSLTAGLFYYSFSKPVYFAGASIVAEGIARELDTQTVFRDSDAWAIRRRLESDALLERTARAMGYRLSAGEVRRHLIRQTRLYHTDNGFYLRVWAYDPQIARDWARVFVEQFAQDRRESRIAYRNQLVTSYTREMALMAEQFRRSRIEAITFEERNRLTELEAELARLQALPGELRNVEASIARLESVHSRINNTDLDVLAKLSIMAQATNLVTPNVGDELFVRPIGGGTGRSVAEGGVTRIIVTPGDQVQESPWSELATKRAKLLAEIQNRSAVFRDGHRVMRQLRTELAEVERDLEAMFKEREHAFMLSYSSALQRRREILEDLRVLHDRQRQVDTLTLERSAMAARGEAWDRFHAQMADILGKVDFVVDRERIDLRYVGLQEFSGSTVSPNKGKLLIGALGFGIGLAVGVAFLLEFFDNSVTRLERVEEELSVRALGLVPLIGENQQLADGAERERQVKHIAENFRVVRTNVMLGAGTDASDTTANPKVILVTSSIPREGKTFVSTNLARSFAQLGERTLLIDADMRRGRIHRSFGFTRDEGLRNLLLGEMTLDEVIVPGDHPNLSVIGSGRYAVEAIEQLGNDTFKKLVHELRGRFDRIVIDSPPMLGLPEVAMMQPVVDGSIFVIWAGHTPLSSIKTSVSSLKAGGDKVLGFVLNRLDLSTSTHYGKYYYYSYDYYYSYTDSSQRS